MMNATRTSHGKPSARKYVVLARRYRPTVFEEVIGQQHVTRTLQNAIRAGRVHHAYLFTGSRGIGKTTVARILARALNDPDGPTPTPRAPDDPEVEARDAVDVIEIDGASHTGVDDVRDLRERARYMPAHSRYKIYIIDEVHMLSTSAFNALLKTLEEPPEHVIFVFATTEPHKIPATILSRCQRFDFKRVPAATIVTHLEQLLEREAIEVAPAGLSLIARAAEGGVRDALSLLDQVIAYASSGDGARCISSDQVAEVLGVADRRVLFELSAAILTKDAAAALAIVDRLFADGHDMAQFAQAFLFHLRDLVVIATCKEPVALVEATDAELAELIAQAGQADGAFLQQLFERLAQAAEQIARSSFPRLLLEMAVIELTQAEPMVPLGDLLERLEAMERRLPGGGGGATKPDGSSPGGTGVSRRSGPATGRIPSRRPAAASKADSAAGLATASANGDAATDTSESAMTRWRALLKQLDGPLAGIFAAGMLLGWEGDRVELGFPASAFELDRAMDPERREAFSRLCAERVGYPVQVHVRGLLRDELERPEGKAYSAMIAAEQEQLHRVERLRQEAESHPAIRALVDGFGATIRQVTTHADGMDR